MGSGLQTCGSGVPSSGPEIIEDLKRKHPRSYTKGKFLGKGGFAKCYEAIDMETQEVYALKVVAKATLVKQRAKAKLVSEIQIHKVLEHPRIVRCYSHFDDTDNVYILLELCPNQSLNELLRRKKRFAEPEAAHYILSLVEGLQYLRKHNVIHRDLKLGNLFLGSQMELKIGDFGLAAKLEFEGQKRLTICGTPNYIAPEILESSQSTSSPRVPSTTGHSLPVDVWSLGVILFTMLVGKPPFEDVDVKATYQRIRDNRYSFPETTYISSTAKSLIGAILRLDPKQRPSLDDILGHPWMRNASVTVPPTIQALNRLSLPPATTPRKPETPDCYNYARIDSPAAATTVKKVLPRVDENTRPTNSLQPSASVGTLRTISKPPVLVNIASPRRPVYAPTPLPSDPLRSSLKGQLALKGFSGRIVGHEGGSLPEVWISKWIDYSSKYGVGYILSNKCLGVYFNDATRMVADLRTFRSVTYITRPKGEKVDTCEVYSLEGSQEFSSDVKKKLILIRNFKNYLITGVDKEGTTKGHSSFATFEGRSSPSSVTLECPPVHLKKWLRTKHATIFQLSNRSWQVSLCFKALFYLGTVQ